jgi:hypothetical protein
VGSRNAAVSRGFLGSIDVSLGLLTNFGFWVAQRFSAAIKLINRKRL